MKYGLLLALMWGLTACGGNSGQALPPEFMVNPEQTVPGNGAEFDPLAEFGTPQTSPTEETESTETVPETTAETPEVVASLDPNVSCEAIVTDLEISLTDMNFCNTDADCAVAPGSCPFGCYIFHNKKLDFADYQPTLDSYRANCNPCEYECAAAPRATDMQCKAGRCVDRRFEG